MSDLAPLFDHLRNHVPLTEADEALLRERVGIRRYRKGQFVTQHGDVCRHESFVLQGCLQQFFTDADGNDHVVMFATEGWWIADLESFLNGTPARFFRLIIQRAYIASQRRVVENVSMPAKERYQAFAERYPLLIQRLPQYRIASYLGMSREFLSKVRKQLLEDL
ncbi:MAG: Crp/Fnr family transcriptional regulator [Bacteroidetes bacterium]|nr:Crp/Fnr family transcriptional regulator [Bacteroidota bacterium]